LSVPASDRLAPGVAAFVLRVGGVDLNGQPATQYPPGSVDVVAPGVDVAALGINGVGPVSVSGTDYAVGYAAAAAALARAAHPTLTVTQLIQRLDATADRSNAATPDPVLGWGMVDPRTAVQAVLAEQSATPGRSTPAAVATRPAAGPARGALLAAVVAVVALAGVLILLRLRRIVRPAGAGSRGVEEVH
jgi:subtilisin family serine protease